MCKKHLVVMRDVANCCFCEFASYEREFATPLKNKLLSH